MYDMCITYARCKELCTRVSENDYPVAPPSLTPLPYGRYKVIGLLHLLVDYYPKTQFFKYSVIKFNVVLLKVPKRSPNCVYCHYCFLAPFHCYKTKLKTLISVYSSGAIFNLLLYSIPVKFYMILSLQFFPCS